MNLAHHRVLAAALALAAPVHAWAQDPAKPVYRCPGPPVLYTDAISPQEARERNCRTIEGAPLTVVQGRRPTPPAASAPAGGDKAGDKGTAQRSADAKVDPAAQRQRDSDARRILEAELRREEDKLDQMKREYNNGEPERRGDERNYAKYQERVAEMKAGIQRKEADVAAIRRELGKLPPP
jgi:hypothetical protein